MDDLIPFFPASHSDHGRGAARRTYPLVGGGGRVGERRAPGAGGGVIKTIATRAGDGR